MSHGAMLELYFGGGSNPGLYRTVFKIPNDDYPIVGLRGPLFNRPSLPFVWTTSSIALSLLFVTAVATKARGEQTALPLLEGDHASPAGALGRLLNKGRRSWLHDIFGSDHNGEPLLKRIILLGNARGRCQGPRTATLRGAYLSPHNIRIFVDNLDISSDSVALEDLKAKLLLDFSLRKHARSSKSTWPQATRPTTRVA